MLGQHLYLSSILLACLRLREVWSFWRVGVLVLHYSKQDGIDLNSFIVDWVSAASAVSLSRYLQLYDAYLCCYFCFVLSVSFALTWPVYDLCRLAWPKCSYACVLNLILTLVWFELLLSLSDIHGYLLFHLPFYSLKNALLLLALLFWFHN